jgi:hypothetical protein
MVLGVEDTPEIMEQEALRHLLTEKVEMVAVVVVNLAL